MRATRTLARVLFWLLLPAALVLCALCAPAGLALGAATLTSFQATASVQWQYDQASTGLTNTTTNRNSFTVTLSTTNGTGAAGTANLIYAVQTTIAGAGNTTLTLAAASLSDFFGNTITMARAKVLYISLLTTTTASSVAVGNATHPLPITNTAAATLQINNGGVFLMGDTGATGFVVGAGATDSIKILNNDGTNTATLQLCFVGSTA